MKNFAKLVSRGCVMASAFCAATIMVVGIVDVVMRYLLNAPLVWAYDTIKLFLLPGLFFLALAEAYRTRRHAYVDLFLRKFSASALRFLLLTGHLFSIVLLALIAWGLLEKAIDAIDADDIYIIGIEVAVWLSLVLPIIGLLAALLVLRLGAEESEPTNDISTIE
ncbi:TRAP transporter small permease [Reyranella sp.]|uniref:TRAP transporter small permease n=1 Tax=Reyranella sp. TaxID=1929291 RepID=UPI0027321494|nr:TRAP transporter small permease subunit [Reyranella sp.]MDP2378369.1 TRAP transporter small permease subunit [Reyranella sp.]